MDNQLLLHDPRQDEAEAKMLNETYITLKQQISAITASLASFSSDADSEMGIVEGQLQLSQLELMLRRSFASLCEAGVHSLKVFDILCDTYSPRHVRQGDIDGAIGDIEQPWTNDQPLMTKVFRGLVMQCYPERITDDLVQRLNAQGLQADDIFSSIIEARIHNDTSELVALASMIDSIQGDGSQPLLVISASQKVYHLRQAVARLAKQIAEIKGSPMWLLYLESRDHRHDPAWRESIIAARKEELRTVQAEIKKEEEKLKERPEEMQIMNRLIQKVVYQKT